MLQRLSPSLGEQWVNKVENFSKEIDNKGKYQLEGTELRINIWTGKRSRGLNSKAGKTEGRASETGRQGTELILSEWQKKKKKKEWKNEDSEKDLSGVASNFENTEKKFT